jgi:cytochrome c-type biogenesis protein CcsB
MKRWIHSLGSMKIAVALLVIILVALAAGTIIESLRNSDAAAAAVYGAPWFRILLALFALNLGFSLVDLWPWGRQRIGFVITHGSILVILLGALATDRLKIEGQLALWEGDQGDVVAGPPARGAVEGPRHMLPFKVRLDAFEIDYYQGTRRPAQFRSRVTVSDPKTGATFPAIIEMNHELSYAGYRLFQSSYQQAEGRDQTVLLVSRDPGQPIVFAGYFLMVGGMLTVLATRVTQRRALARATRAQHRNGRRTQRAAGVVVALLGLAAIPGAARAEVRVYAGAPFDGATVEALRRLPVQNDGRVMPLDTMAREATEKVTGRARWQRIDPVALVLGWTIEPQRWANEAIVRIGGPDLAQALGYPAGQTHASFLGLVQNQTLMRLIGQARAVSGGGQPPSSLLHQAESIEERLVLLQRFLNREAIAPVPGADPRAAWSAPATPQGAQDFKAVLDAGVAAPFAPAAAMRREVLYNRAHPTRLAWCILSAAALAALFSMTTRRRVYAALAFTALVAGFAVMTWGIAQRWFIAGRIPASNMYESLLFLGWGVGLFAVVAFVFLRNRLVVLNAAAMSALTMALADLLPIDPYIHPMPPVLAGTAWLAIHVPIIMLSYSVLALGVFIAHAQIGAVIAAPGRRDLALKLNDLLYWYIQIGSILLIAGILTGSMWAASSWGRYWGWDPKEVWSLIAFLAYLAILHGRFDRFIGVFGVAALSIVAFWTILMTYIGVNFVLASGLHSYGFGGSGVVRWMLVLAAVEGLFLGVGYLSQSARASNPALANR